jgi:hypothetical protein
LILYGVQVAKFQRFLQRQGIKTKKNQIPGMGKYEDGEKTKIGDGDGDRNGNPVKERESPSPLQFLFFFIETTLVERKHFLAICVKPLFFYNDWIQLVQFVEYWLIAGATKFLIYYQSISPAVKLVIDIYVNNEVDIELIAWPSLSNNEADLLLHFTGQIESANDCLHRARTHAQFAAFVDLDEFIFAKNEVSLE